MVDVTHCCIIWPSSSSPVTVIYYVYFTAKKTVTFILRYTFPRRIMFLTRANAKCEALVTVSRFCQANVHIISHLYEIAFSVYNCLSPVGEL